MDIPTLATAAWTVIAPLLPMIASKGTEEWGKQVGGTLWEAVKKKFDSDPETKKVVEKLLSQPKNERVQGAFQYHLEELLEADAAFAKKLETLIKNTAKSYIAYLEGGGAIAQGEGATAVGAGGISIGGSVSGSTIVTGNQNVIGNITDSLVNIAGRDVSQVINESQKPKNNKDFEAYPDVDTPQRVKGEECFTVRVGFRSSPDLALSDHGPIRVQNLPADAKFDIFLMAEGAEILDTSPRKQLAPNRTDEVIFECQPQPGVDKIKITVEYIYNYQTVGLVSRDVYVGDQKPDETEWGEPEAHNPCRLTVNNEDRPDIELKILYSHDHQYLNWYFTAAAIDEINAGPFETHLENAREFASDLLQQVEQGQDLGEKLLNEALETIGQQIADKIPRQIIALLRKTSIKLNRTPTLLLATEEAYIPWELAWLDPPLDSEKPTTFLTNQVIMGRWFYHDRVIYPPPANLTMQQFSVVAVEPKQLKYAKEEQEILRKISEDELHVRTELLPAIVTSFSSLIAKKEPGRFLHFAGHGTSNPKLNMEFITLDDEKKIRASNLAGAHACGDTPNFTFVFLNACQVGTSGNCLGQAAGFPGDLIRGGTLGFIAPLWKVPDKPALELAQHFYTQTLITGQSVGEFLHQKRLTSYGQEAITPLAYIYYGHPTLRLVAQPEEVKDV